MSNIKDKLKLAVQSAKALSKDIVQGNDLTVSQEVFNERMAICAQCPKFIKETKQCGECGCFLALKAKGASFTCPLNKWPTKLK